MFFRINHLSFYIGDLLKGFNLDERRRSIRFKVNFPSSFGGFFGELFDLSEGGACFKSNKFLNKGFKGELDFSIPGGNEIITTAKVMWTSESHCGLKFIKMDNFREIIRTIS